MLVPSRTLRRAGGCSGAHVPKIRGTSKKAAREGERVREIRERDKERERASGSPAAYCIVIVLGVVLACS